MSAQAFDLSNILPTNWKSPWDVTYYKKGDVVDMLVNDVESELTGRAYAYYRLPFVCPPKPETRPVGVSMGAILNGDRLWKSDYELHFEVDEECHRLCDRSITPDVIRTAAKLIEDEYVVSWYIDGLPAATTLIKPKSSLESARKYYVPGFSLGFYQNGNSYLHNHVMLVIRWHEDRSTGQKSIVGFEVFPKSVSDARCPGAAHNFDNFYLDTDLKSSIIVPFTYSVYWREEPDVDYAHRFDMYLLPGTTSKEGRMHWFAIINSLVLLSLISLFAAIVLTKAFKAGPNVAQWTKVSDNVFTQPPKLGLLCSLAGSGFQLLITIAGLCVLMFTGMKAPTRNLVSIAISLFVAAGFFAGFSSVQFYKRFSAHYSDGSCIRVALLSGSCLSAICVTVLAVANMLSSDTPGKRLAHPVETGSLQLFAAYLFLQIPLSIVGGIVSLKVDVLVWLLSSTALPKTEYTYKVSTPVPPQPKYNKWYVSLPACGIFPFGIIFIEMVFLYKTLWTDKATFHAMYGFLSLTTVLLFVMICEISVITTYLRLDSGDYVDWQWKSFLTCTLSILFYLFAYTLYYLWKMKMVDAVSPLLYLTYSIIFNSLISVACGAMGLAASTVFVYKIYTSRKED